MIVEVNATDGDAEAPSLPRRRAVEVDERDRPRRRTILDVDEGATRPSWLTELFSESSEPPISTSSRSRSSSSSSRRGGTRSSGGRSSARGSRVRLEALACHPGGAEDRASADGSRSRPSRHRRSLDASSTAQRAGADIVAYRRSSPPKRPDFGCSARTFRRRPRHRGPRAFLATRGEYKLEVQAIERSEPDAHRGFVSLGEGVRTRARRPPQAQHDRSPLCREVEAEREPRTDRIDNAGAQRDREPRPSTFRPRRGQPAAAAAVTTRRRTDTGRGRSAATTTPSRRTSSNTLRRSRLPLPSFRRAE